MREINRKGLIVAFVAVVVLFAIFGGSTMSGSFMDGGGMMGRGWNGGYSWMWIPTLITLAVGVLLGWAIFGKKG